jgi:tetratricopeptide (TPR) repeat protein
VQQSPKLSTAYYYLGRAELQLNHQQAALDNFERVLQLDKGGEVTRQAYYQMAQLYRKMNRPQDAANALAAFQKLKQEAAEKQSQLFEKKRKMQEQNSEDLPPLVGDQNY